MTTATPDRIVLSDDDATVLSAASRLMGAALDHSRANSVALVEEGTDGDIARIEVPPATLRVLSRVLAMMASQQVFLLYPADTELTTKQAADLLGVSRPFLIARLEAGDLPFRKVGRYRRMRMDDVVHYKESMRASRKGALDDVVADSESIDGSNGRVIWPRVSRTKARPTTPCRRSQEFATQWQAPAAMVGNRIAGPAQIFFPAFLPKIRS
ncbi:hypothetical protein bAD24_III08405 [Burkholderia sp. AD24]|nr:hypothetical protein bAD24_III08405 [Burkholderia sp. AD24]